MQPIRIMATLALVAGASPLVLADTYHSASFSGQISPGNANVKAPFNTVLTQGSLISGTFVYDDQLVPPNGTGFQNVPFSSFPEYAQIPSAVAFQINLGGGLVFDLSNALDPAAVQFNNGSFNGFFFDAAFAFEGHQYLFMNQGGTFNITLFDNNQITFNALVNGTLNIGTNALTNIVTYTAPVPLPVAVWMFSAAVGGLGFVRRRFA